VSALDLDPTTVAAVVREIIGDTTAQLLHWSARPIRYQVINRSTAGLYRVTGSAQGGDRIHSWSVFLKLLRHISPDPTTRFNSSVEPGDWSYWRREAEVYSSALLADLPPGLAAPRCYAITGPAHDQLWLWLEDIHGQPGTIWPLERFALAATHLGRRQGDYLTRARSFDAPWLSRGWLRAWVPDAIAGHITLAREPAAWHHPLVAPLFPASLADSVLRLWEDSALLLTEVEQLPQTLCHLDVWPPNLFAHPAVGGEETVLVDWSQVGPGAPGEDIANLVLDSVWMQQVGEEHLNSLETLALEGYLEGLWRAGWHGPDQLVRFGYAATAALRFGLLAGAVLDQARRSELHAGMEKRYSRPIGQVLAARAAVVTQSLRLADAARALLRA
jgi:hypothetical protein